MTKPQNENIPGSTGDPAQDSVSEVPPAGDNTQATRKTLFRLALLLLGSALLLSIVHFSPLSGFFDDLQAFRDTLDDTDGLGAELLYLVVNIVGVALGAPRLIFYALSGATFGVWKGLLLAQAGTLTGSYLAYLVVRRMGREWVNRYFGGRLKPGWMLGGLNTSWSVFLLRQLPISSGLLNLAMGLSTVRSWPFLVGSFLGYLPQGVIVLLIADGIMEEDMLDGALQLFAAIAALVGIGIWGLRRRSKPDSIKN